MAEENLRASQARAAKTHKQLLELYESTRVNRDITGETFENIICRAFELEGARVKWPFRISSPASDAIMEQMDGAIYLKEGYIFLVESKDTSKALNIEPIAKLRQQLQRRPRGPFGLVFSSAGFTNSALVLSMFDIDPAVFFWDGQEIKKALKEKCFIQGTIKKLHTAIELGSFHNYNVFLGDINE